MWPFKKKKYFNAVIEGTFHDEWYCFRYKLTRIDVPPDVEILDDGIYHYILRDSGLAEVVHEIEGLLDCEGLVLGDIFSNRPRSVFLRDGRVFVEEGLMHDEYSGLVSELQKNAEVFFQDKRFSELYRLT